MTFIQAALAIIDDIGAICLIGIFYSQDVDASMLLYAFLLLMALILINYAGVRKPLPYYLLALGDPQRLRSYAKTRLMKPTSIALIASLSLPVKLQKIQQSIK